MRTHCRTATQPHGRLLTIRSQAKLNDGKNRRDNMNNGHKSVGHIGCGTMQEARDDNGGAGSSMWHYADKVDREW